MRQPEGFVKKGEEKLVCRLIRSLYGLKQSPRMWNQVLHEALVSLGFKQLDSDPCIYTGIYDGEEMMIAVYVDDKILACRNEVSIQKLKKQIGQRFAIKDLGRLHYFLGVRINQLDDGSVWMGQETYVENLLTKYGLSDSKTYGTPMEVNSKPEEDEESAKSFDQHQYLSAIGSLLYLTSATRPDIAYAVNKMAQFSANPTTVHWAKVKRIIEYLKGTKNLGLHFTKKNLELIGYSDADFAGDIVDRKSTSGFVFTRGGAAISWMSRKQSMVALSTTESEYVAMSAAVSEVKWLQNLLESMTGNNNKPTTMFEDNKSAIFLTKNPVLHRRSKHIEVKYHNTRDEQEKGTINVVYCPTEVMVADVLTKPLPKPRFEKLRLGLGLCCDPSPRRS